MTTKPCDKAVDEGLTIRLLRGVWRTCVDSLAICGACMLGHPSLQGLHHDADQLARSRQLAVLDDHILRDIGFTQADVNRQLMTPIWRL